MRWNRVLGNVLCLTGAGIILYWAVFILQGRMVDGLRTVEHGGYVVIHVVAEAVMALAAVAAGVLLRSGQREARTVGSFALGALIYAGLDNLGWALLDDRVLAVVFALLAAFGGAGLWMLLLERDR